MEGTEDLTGMGLFESSGLELDFNDLESLGLEETTDPDETGTPEKGDEKNIPPVSGANEDENPESVVGDEDQEGKDHDSDDADTSPNLYSSFASALSEQGLLPSLDLESGETKIENIDDLSTALKSEIDTQVKDYLIAKVGDEGYEALNKGISLAEYQQHQDNVLTLEGISENDIVEDIELSKKIIYQDYLAQGIGEQRAARLLNKSIDAGEAAIIEDAKESLESLKITETKRLAQLAEDRQEQTRIEAAKQEKIDNDLKNSIYNSQEIIKGIKVNKTIQDRVYQSITKVVGKSPAGVLENQLMKDRRENPVDFDSKLYYLYELTKGFSDFTKLVNKSQTTAVGQLEKALQNTKFDTAGGTPDFLRDPESYSGGIGSEIVL